jgi:hypothetical protein
MPAANYDLYIEQGATYSQEFVWKDSEGTPIDLSTYTSRMQVRQVKTENIILNLTNTSGMTLGDDGSIKIEVSATATSALPTLSARYDLELQSTDGTVTRLLQGEVVISAEVTR